VRNRRRRASRDRRPRRRWDNSTTARGVGKALGRLAIVAAHVEQDRFRPLAQGDHVDSRRHGKQDVPRPHAFAGTVGGFVCGMVATTGFFRRFGRVKLTLEQQLDGG
jgi:hypothetical protein